MTLKHPNAGHSTVIVGPVFLSALDSPSIYPFIHPFILPSFNLFIYPSQPIQSMLSIYPPAIHSSIHPATHPYIYYLHIDLSIFPSLPLSLIHSLSPSLSSIHPSIHLHTCPSLPSLRQFQHPHPPFHHPLPPSSIHQPIYLPTNPSLEFFMSKNLARLGCHDFTNSQKIS